MPDSAYQKGDQDVEIAAWLAASVSPQWYIYVVFEPLCQCDVPAMPKVGYADGKIGISEVGWQIVAKSACGSDSHQGIAGEIGVKLE